MGWVKIALSFFWMLFSCSVGVLLFPFVRGKVTAPIAHLLSWGVLKIVGVKVKVVGGEHLQTHEPCIYAGNHQSALDVMTFGSIFTDNCVVIGKKELIWIPVLGALFWAAGNLLIDRQHRDRAYAQLERLARLVKARGVSVIVFPEGTRNKSGVGLLPFKRGPFFLAVEAQIPIVPIVSSYVKDIVDLKHGKVWGGEVTLTVLPPILVAGRTKDDIDALREEVRDKMLAVLG